MKNIVSLKKLLQTKQKTFDERVIGGSGKKNNRKNPIVKFIREKTTDYISMD